MRVDEELGPVQFCIGSHKDRPVPVLTSDPEHPEKSGAYAMVLHDRDRRIAAIGKSLPSRNRVISS